MSRFSSLEFESEDDGELRSDPVNAPKGEVFHLREAQAAFEGGEFERALRSFARVLEHNPGNPLPWTGQVRMLIELGEYREAKLWADKALERFPREPELLAAKAVALARSGDLNAAMAFSDASFEERGDTPYLWVARADVLLARRESRADYCFAKALSQEPRDWFLRLLIARVQYHYDQFVLSLKSIQEALALDATQAVLWFQCALCQRQLGLIEAADLSLTQALLLNPNYAAAKAAQLDEQADSPSSRVRGWLRRFFSK